MVSLLVSFVLSFFPRDVLNEIWDLTDSASEGFLTYSFMKTSLCSHDDGLSGVKESYRVLAGDAVF